MEDFFDQVYWGNTVLDYTMVLGGILLAWIVVKIVKKRILSLLKKLARKTTTNFDDLIIKAIEEFVIPYAYLFINYHIITQLDMDIRIARILEVALLVITAYYVIRLINFLIHGSVLFYMEQKNEPPERIRQLNGILLVLKACVWLAGLVMLIDNLGYDVTTIIAGLGVGGIAIALAAQNILGDLFSYLVIFFDKPFEIGDFIVMGDHSGTVERIGIKTSHVRSLDGQQLVMPNSELVSSVINNFKRLERRRIVFAVGVIYSTPAEQLRKIPGMIKEIIDKREKATFDRAHFKSFGDFSLNYEIVYYSDSIEYIDMMDTHHAVCIAIFEKFGQEGIEFAFPTQTLFLEKTAPEQGKETVS